MSRVYATTCTRLCVIVIGKKSDFFSWNLVRHFGCVVVLTGATSGTTTTLLVLYDIVVCECRCKISAHVIYINSDLLQDTPGAQHGQQVQLQFNSILDSESPVELFIRRGLCSP